MYCWFRPRLSSVACYAAISVLLLLVGSAQAATPTSRQARERAARKACLAGDYAKGVSILSDLFLDTSEVIYIFNQGRCLEQNQRYEDAIGRFREYLRVGKKLSASDSAVAEKHIADCEALLGRQPSGSVQPPPTAVIEPPIPVVPPPAPAPEPPVIVVRQPAEPSSTGKGAGLRTAGIVTAAVGVAAVAAGVVLGLKVSNMAHDMESTPGAYSESKESDRKTYATLGWVSYGIGGAAIATGAVLYIIGIRAKDDQPANLAVVPAIQGGNFGAVLKGAF